MSRKYVGHRALGGMTPEARSAFLNLSRAVRGLSQSQRTLPTPGQSEPVRRAGLGKLIGPSRGGQGTAMTCGKDIDKPSVTYLKQRGIKALMYVAQDTNIVYIWNGSAYKSSTFT